MKRGFITIITAIYDRIKEEVENIGLVSLGYKTQLSNRVVKKLEAKIKPLIDDMFSQSIIESNLIVKTEVAKLADKIKLPLKYNKDLIDKFNTDKSLFTGFYNSKYKQEFTNGEIDRLKRVILQSKYGGLSETETISNIRDAVKVSRNRAMVIARQESARLDTAAQSIYYQDPAVKKEFDKVWSSQSDARPSHKWMDGQIADEDGWFITQDGDKIQGPPLGYGCRCRLQLIRKKK